MRIDRPLPRPAHRWVAQLPPAHRARCRPDVPAWVRASRRWFSSCPPVVRPLRGAAAALAEPGHLGALGGRLRTGKRTRRRLGSGEPPLPPVRCRALLPPGVPSPTAWAPLPQPHALPSAGSLRAARPGDSPVVSPGEVFVTVTELQDFIVSERGQRPPMWATAGPSEQRRLQSWLCEQGLARSPAGAGGKMSVARWVGGSLGRWRVVPGPASRICGAREMRGLFWGVGVRCLSGRSLLLSFSDLPSSEFLFLIAALG